MQKGHPIYKTVPRTSRTLSLKKQEAFIRKVAVHYGVGVYFYTRINDWGGFVKIKYDKRGPFYIVYINKCKDNDYINTFFHELGHVHCYRTGKWLQYHSLTDYTTAEERIKALRAHISTGLRAELWVDKWASLELKKWLPRYKYDFVYSQPYARTWYEDNYLAEFREELDKLKNQINK